jgi:cytochrome oxidase Cu insertion factor (SCO1/SenC/PrrC family)
LTILSSDQPIDLKEATFTKRQSQFESAICSAAIDLSEFETLYKSTSYKAHNPGSLMQGVFVTVDPERDKPEMLKAYMVNFDDSFVAFVPTPAELGDLAKKFKIYYKRVEGQTPTSYTMDHSAGSYVYDQQGRLRLFGRYGLGAEKLAQDIQVLIKQGQ